MSEERRRLCLRLSLAMTWLDDVYIYSPKEVEEAGIYEAGDLLDIIREVRDIVEDAYAKIKCPEELARRQRHG